MANKLKDLQVTKVDFVDAGANPEANIVLFKRKPEAATDPAKPQAESSGGFFRSIVAAIAKSVGATTEQVDAAMEEIAKGAEATTFGEKMVERQLRRTCDEIWDYCYALEESLTSILRDQDVPAENKPTLMSQSCSEFAAAVTAAIPKWSAGVPTKVEKSAEKPLTEERLQIAKEAAARLDAMIQKAEAAKAQSGAAGNEPEGVPTENNPDGENAAKSNTEKGDHDMKIDKSKLSPEELATLDAIEKKAGIPEDTPAPAPETDPVAKSTEPVPASAPAAGDTDDIYKGIHPAVAEELRSLRKFREETEDAQIMAVAKKYELLGKKPEELAPVLKSLKAAGGTAYADMIGVLDANLAVMQASPAFTEIGKRGGAAPVNDADNAWAQIEKKAEEIRKSAPALSYAEAIDKACEQNPDLVHQYESNR